MRPGIRTLLGTGTVLVATVLVCNALISTANTRRLAENNRRVVRTLDTLGRLDQALSKITDAETGQRGYLLTGRESYLEPYDSAVSTLGDDLRRLKSSLDDPDQQRRVGTLEGKVDEKLAELRETVTLRREKGAEAASRIVLTGRGKRVMDDIRRLVGEMAGQERGRLVRRTAESEASLDRSIITFFVASASALLVITLLLIFALRFLASRQRYEDDLRAQLERWRVTLAGIGDGVIVTDAEGRVTFTNPVAESLCGWTLVAARGRPLAEVFRIVNEETRMPVEHPVEKVLATGNIIGLANHTVLIARDGKGTAIDDSAAPLIDDRGRVIGVVLVFRDVAERRRAAELTERLASIVESSDDIIIAKTLDGIITSWNRGSERVLGYSADEVLGRHVSMLMPPECIEDTERILGMVRGGERVDHYETKRRRKDGKLIDVSLTVSPIRDASGRIIGASKIGRDITERKSVEAERLEADRRKDEFLAMLAHELRNPLAAIRSAVDTIDMPGAEAHLNWAKEVINRQVGHLAFLIDDLLDVSRITRGMIQLRKQAIDAYPVINHAIDSVRPLIDDRKHRFEVSIKPRPMRLEADPVRLEQILVNLLTNAAKYTPSGGQIHLSAEHAGDQIVIRVRDSGVGIPPEVLPTIFELFAQGERSLARSEGGLGIGLTIVRNLVELHGGSISATSGGPDLGSEFIVRLPASEEQPTAPTTSPSDRIGDRGSRILIIDDNRDLVRGLTRLLKLLGHEIEAAYDGHSGVEAARTYRPEVILLDIGLPGMDGYEVARTLRGEAGLSEVRIIAISGYGHEEDRRRSREAGMDHHLVKPVDIETLTELIARPA